MKRTQDFAEVTSEERSQEISAALSTLSLVMILTRMDSGVRQLQNCSGVEEVEEVQVVEHCRDCRCLAMPGRCLGGGRRVMECRSC